MPPASPAKAIVRPRVSSRLAGDARLLEDVIAELIDDSANDVIWIVGGPGSGKSTALAHLAACFTGDERLAFLDEPLQVQVNALSEGRIVIATSDSVPQDAELILRLQPWGMDELVEYLFTVDRASCNSVIGRLGLSGKLRWWPQVACIVLQQFLQDASLTDPGAALILELRDQLSSQEQREAAAKFCLAALISGTERILEAAKEVAQAGCSGDVFKFLQHREFQHQVLTEHIVSRIGSLESCDELAERLPHELIELLAARCAANEDAMQGIERLLLFADQPMVASIKFCMDSRWCPARFITGRKLAGGYFCGAHWPLVNLASAKLWGGDFSAADLSCARLDYADATGAKFDGAEMQGAHLNGMSAPSTSFCGTDLQEATLASGKFHEAVFVGANLTQARLTGADLIRADFTGAKLCRADLESARLQHAILAEADLNEASFESANLTQCDLHEAQLSGACFDRAILVGAQMEDIEFSGGQFSGAQLINAHLTGSRMPRVTMRDANLAGAYLAEIEWEGADLRGAD